MRSEIASRAFQHVQEIRCVNLRPCEGLNIPTERVVLFTGGVPISVAWEDWARFPFGNTATALSIGCTHREIAWLPRGEVTFKRQHPRTPNSVRVGWIRGLGHVIIGPPVDSKPDTTRLRFFGR